MIQTYIVDAEVEGGGVTPWWLVVDEESDYQIVSEMEADVKQGRISITSPIARALIGKEVGDSVEVNTPGGGKSYEVLEIKFG